MQDNLKKIKFSSIRSIFNFIASSKNVSRAAISDKTHLSVVTVGKIADALINMDIIVQSKGPSQIVGRRAGILNVNKSRYILIFDLTAYKFRAALLDLSLSQKDSFEWKYDVLSPFPDNLKSFIQNAKIHFFKKFGEENCIGVGCTVPDIYDPKNDCVRTHRIPEIILVPIRGFFERFFPEKIIYVEPNSVSAARTNIEQVDEYQTKDIIYLYSNENCVSGAHFINGAIVGGCCGGACDFGRMIFDVDLTLNERIVLCKNEFECADLLSGLIYNLIKIVSPHAFIFEFDMKFKTDNLTTILKERLLQRYKLPQTHTPEFLPAKHSLKNSYCGISLMIRDIWLQNKML